MKLNVIERVLLSNIMFNYKGNFTNLKLVRVGSEALSFNEEENAQLNFTSVGNGNVTWDYTASLLFQDVEIDLSDHIVEIIKAELLKLNKAEQLTEQHFSLYEKFMEPNLKVI